jgi:hypothetical protein
MQQIAQWLEKLGMSECAQRFNEIGFAVTLPSGTSCTATCGMWQSTRTIDRFHHFLRELGQ